MRKFIYVLMFLLLLGLVKSTSWNTSFSTQFNINITNNNVTRDLRENYTISLEIDHSTYISTGLCNLTSGNDLRIVYDGDTELDRINLTGWNESNTVIAFRLYQNISPSSIDTAYTLECGNINATVPPNNLTRVFLPCSDDFNYPNSAIPVGWSEWLTGESAITANVQNGRYQINTNHWREGYVYCEMANNSYGRDIGLETWLIRDGGTSVPVLNIVESGEGTTYTYASMLQTNRIIKQRPADEVELSNGDDTGASDGVLYFHSFNSSIDGGLIAYDSLSGAVLTAHDISNLGISSIGLTAYDTWSFDNLRVYYTIEPNPTILIGSVGEAPPSPPVALFNTSIFVADFNNSDVTFSSADFFNAYVNNFNTTGITNLTLLTSFNILKNTGAGTNIIIGKILVDGIEQTTESLRTVSSQNDEGVTGFFPLNFQVNSGIHNITIQFRRTGNGEIEINDVDTLLLEYQSDLGNSVRTQLNKVEFTHSSTDFILGYNWTISAIGESIFILNKQLINGSGAVTGTYLFNDVVDGENSSKVIRFLSSSTDLGAIGNLWTHTGLNEQFSLLSRTNGNDITVNTTILDFDLEDSANNSIKFYNNSNQSTDIINTITLTSGKHLLTSVEHKQHAGTSSFLSAVVSFNGTSGIQTPTFIINSSNNSIINCFSKKERYLSSNNDIGNVYFYTLCDNLVINETYIFNLWAIVESGETIIIQDEFLTGFDATLLNTSAVSGLETMEISTDLTNNTINFNNLTLQTTYNFTIGAFNTIDVADCSLLFNDLIQDTQTNRNDSIDYLFNVSTSTIEENVSIRIECTNSEINESSAIFNYRIDVINPIIRSTFTNLTAYTQFNNVIFNVNFTDSNLFAYNISFFSSDNTELENYFAFNLTQTFAKNITTRLATTIGVFTIRSSAWDSHTTNEISNYKIDYLENGLEFEDIIKIYGDNVTTKETTKLKNRYSFSLGFEKGITWKTIYIESTGYLIYLPNSTYKIHFVDFNNKKWIDFDSFGYSEYKVTQVTPHKYKIELRSKGISELEFNSIGDLNSAEVIYTYTVIAQAPVLNLTINLTGVENAIKNVGGDLLIIGLIIFVGIFFFIGIIARQPLYWNFSGVGLLVIAFKFADNLQTSDTLFNLWTAILFLTLALLIMLLSVFLFIRNRMENRKANDFYTM